MPIDETTGRWTSSGFEVRPPGVAECHNCYDYFTEDRLGQHDEDVVVWNGIEWSNARGFWGSEAQFCEGCRRTVHACQAVHPDGEDGPCGRRVFSNGIRRYPDFPGQTGRLLYICRTCAYQLARLCRYCETWRDINSTFHEYGGSNYCESCTSERFTHCDECDQMLPNGRFHQGEYHPCFVDLRSLLMSYSHKPRPIFHPGYRVEVRHRVWREPGIGEVMRPKELPSPLYMGMELELDLQVSGAARIAASKEAKRVKEQHARFLYLKSDGTVSDGMELVTHPFTWNWARNNFPFHEVERLAEVGFLGESGRNNGMHVHVSKSAFEKPHLWRFLRFQANSRRELVALARRDSHNWANWDSAIEQVEDLARYLNRGQRFSNSHHTALNLGNNDTVELRYFKATTDPFILKATLQLINGMHEYTKDLPLRGAKEDGLLEWGSFASWVVDNAGSYEELGEYMDRKGVLVTGTSRS